MIVRNRLALEYDGSSGAVFVIESGYGEAHSFSSETNWYIGTIVSAVDNGFSIHFSFYTVYAVSSIVDGHNDGLFVVLDGNGASIVVIGNSSVERFSECADRNHGSPVAVYIWGSVHFEELLVNHILAGTDSHNYFMMSINAAITSGVRKGTSIEPFVGSIVNNDNNVYFSWLRSINSQSTFAFRNIRSFNSNNCIFIALVCYISFHSATYLSNVTVFINNRYSYLVVFVDRTFYRIELEAIAIVRINNSQSFLNELMIGLGESGDSDGGTEQRFICCDIIFCHKHITWCNISIYDSLTIKTKVYISSIDLQTVFINIFSANINILAKRYFVSNVNSSVLSTSIYCPHIKNSILNFPKFRYIKGGFCIVTAKQGYGYSVLTRDEVFLFIVANVFQGVVIPISNENEIPFIELRTSWLCRYIKISCMFITHSIIRYFACWFICNSINTSYRITSFISDGKLYSVGESVSTIFIDYIVPIILIGTSEYISIIKNGIDVICLTLFFDDTKRISYIVARNSDRDISVVIHFELEFKITFVVSFYNTVRSITDEPQNFIITSGKSNFFINSRTTIFLKCIAAYSASVTAICLKSIINEIQFAEIVYKWNLSSIAIEVETINSEVNAYSYNVGIIRFNLFELCNIPAIGLHATNTCVEIIYPRSSKFCVKFRTISYSAKVIHIWSISRIYCSKCRSVILCISFAGIERNTIYDVTIFISCPYFNIR